MYAILFHRTAPTHKVFIFLEQGLFHAFMHLWMLCLCLKYSRAAWIDFKWVWEFQAISYLRMLLWMWLMCWCWNFTPSSFRKGIHAEMDWFMEGGGDIFHAGTNLRMFCICLHSTKECAEIGSVLIVALLAVNYLSCWNLFMDWMLCFRL